MQSEVTHAKADGISSPRLRLGKPSLLTNMKSFHYVYILVSERHPEIHYTGLSQNLDSRLKKHNNGDCHHTAKYRPWFIESAVAFRDKEKAAAFEQYLKSGSGREFARRHF